MVEAKLNGVIRIYKLSSDESERRTSKPVVALIDISSVAGTISDPKEGISQCWREREGSISIDLLGGREKRSTENGRKSQGILAWENVEGTTNRGTIDTIKGCSPKYILCYVLGFDILSNWEC
jgi:hypothetical protein